MKTIKQQIDEIKAQGGAYKAVCGYKPHEVEIYAFDCGKGTDIAGAVIDENGHKSVETWDQFGIYNPINKYSSLNLKIIEVR